MPRYKKPYHARYETYEVRKTGREQEDRMAEEVVHLLNKGYKKSAFSLAVYYGIPWLISLAGYAAGYAYLAYNGFSI